MSTVCLSTDGATWSRNGSALPTSRAGKAGQLNRGISAELVAEFVDVVRSGEAIYSLEAELGYTPLFAARKLGLDEEWLDRLEAHNPTGRRALTVSRLVAGSPAASVLRNGDMILAVMASSCHDVPGAGARRERNPR